MKRKYLILFSLSGLILTCDQLAKHLVHTFFQLNESRPVFGPFISLTYLRNSGFGFGLFENTSTPFRGAFVVGIPVFALFLILLIFIKLRDNQILTSVALTTILGGAIGNLIDRIKYGYVIDFLDISWSQKFSLPPFNIADCSILVGVAIMFINTLLIERNRAL